MRYVIIGNSAAAVGAVEGIRQVDAEGVLTVVAQEPHFTYSRPLISYLLQGRTDEQRMRYRPAGFYERMGCEARLGQTVTALQPEAHTLTLSTGETLPYDRLLVAAGSRPFVPPLPGLDAAPDAQPFWSLDDARALARKLTPASRVLILGAGLIGLKCAEGISGRCASITVVDLASHILPSILDEQAAGLVQHHLEQRGLSFRLGDAVSALSPQAATLQSGQTLPFDQLVLAVGVRPNTSLVEAAGGPVARGIVTDDACRTTLPDVYAAGDCAECLDCVTGNRRVLALLPNAYAQGRCAGINMAGGQATYDHALAMNAISLFGLHILSAGDYDGDAYLECDERHYKKLCAQGDRLRGFILVGDVAQAGIYTALIREATPLSAIDYNLICRKPQLLAFSRQERVRKLGGMPA